MYINTKFYGTLIFYYSSEKIVKQAVYKKPRNRVISELRKDNLKFNNERNVAIQPWWLSGIMNSKFK